MTTTLVVVDMQSAFEAACSFDVVVGVTEQILYAKQQQWPIVILEYEGCGETHEALIKLLKNYRHKARIKKFDNDGSIEVIRCIRRRNFPHNRLRVCGVNADCCVYETVEGLINRLEFSQVELAKDACGTTNGKVDWRRYFRHSRFNLV